MAIPKTKEEFKQYCLRQLGAPVIKINVAKEQVDDCVDSAVNFYQHYHYDGVFETYYVYSLTDQDKINKFITLPDSIIGVSDILDMGTSLDSNNIFDVRYQLALNDFHNLSTSSIIPYYMVFQHLSFLQEILVGKKPIRYNEMDNKLYIDMNWNQLQTGMYIIIKCFEKVDPEKNPKMWADHILQKYTTCLIKQMMGNNLKKYGDMKMPGGVSFNGQRIYDEATQERNEIETDFQRNYSAQSSMMIG